jgi:hypothetical protein
MLQAKLCRIQNICEQPEETADELKAFAIRVRKELADYRVLVEARREREVTQLQARIQRFEQQQRLSDERAQALEQLCRTYAERLRQNNPATPAKTTTTAVLGQTGAEVLAASVLALRAGNDALQIDLRETAAQLATVREQLFRANEERTQLMERLDINERQLMTLQEIQAVAAQEKRRQEEAAERDGAGQSKEELERQLVSIFQRLEKMRENESSKQL